MPMGNEKRVPLVLLDFLAGLMGGTYGCPFVEVPKPTSSCVWPPVPTTCQVEDLSNKTKNTHERFHVLPSLRFPAKEGALAPEFKLYFHVWVGGRLPELNNSKATKYRPRRSMRFLFPVAKKKRTKREDVSLSFVPSFLVCQPQASSCCFLTFD
jgi:hypothetical protein